MNRTDRRQLAEATLAILDRGRYAVGGRIRDIGIEFAAAVAGTRLSHHIRFAVLDRSGERSIGLASERALTTQTR